MVLKPSTLFQDLNPPEFFQNLMKYQFCVSCQAFRNITPSQSNNWATSGASGLLLHHSESTHPELGPKITQPCSLSFEQLPHTALDLHHLTLQPGSSSCQIQGLCPKVHNTELFNTNPFTGGKTVVRRLRNILTKEGISHHLRLAGPLGGLGFFLLCCQGMVHLFTA